MTALPKSTLHEHRKTTEIQCDQRTGGKESKRSGERNEHSRFQVQLEEDEGGSTRQSWMKTSTWQSVAYDQRKRQGLSQVKSSQEKSIIREKRLP